MISGLNRPGFWRQRARDPIVFLLRQGLDPGALALSLAAGLVLGLFPIIGATTVLCLAAGFAFRLSHVAPLLFLALLLLLRPPLRRFDQALRGRGPAAPA